MFYYDYPIIGLERELPLYLINMGLQHCQEHTQRTEGYPCHQILFCTKGSGTLIFDGKKHLIPANTAFYLPPNYPHEYYPNEEIWDIHWVVPGGFCLPDLFSHFHLTEPAVFKIKESQKLETLFRSMHEALHSDVLFGNYRASGYLYEFLLEFYRLISLKESGEIYSSTLLKALDYVNIHFTEQISLNTLCQICHVSKQHLCFLFRTTLHMRPMEYITRKRIQAAKEQLSGTAKSIETIAEETGFCTASYFCKMFKRYENMTANEFRREAIQSRLP